jgi:hypothetical protein
MTASCLVDLHGRTHLSNRRRYEATPICITSYRFQPVTCGLSPPRNQSEGDANNLTPVKWPVDLVLISNEEEKAIFLNMDRIHDITGPTNIRIGQLSAA